MSTIPVSRRAIWQRKNPFDKRTKICGLKQRSVHFFTGFLLNCVEIRQSGDELRLIRHFKWVIFFNIDKKKIHWIVIMLRLKLFKQWSNVIHVCHVFINYKFVTARTWLSRGFRFTNSKRLININNTSRSNLSSSRTLTQLHEFTIEKCIRYNSVQSIAIWLFLFRSNRINDSMWKSIVIYTPFREKEKERRMVAIQYTFVSIDVIVDVWFLIERVMNNKIKTNRAPEKNSKLSHSCVSSRNVWSR